MHEYFCHIKMIDFQISIKELYLLLAVFLYLVVLLLILDLKTDEINWGG